MIDQHCAPMASLRVNGHNGVELKKLHDDPMMRQTPRDQFSMAFHRRLADYLRENWPSRSSPALGQVSGYLSSTKTTGNMGTMSMFRSQSHLFTRVTVFSSNAIRSVLLTIISESTPTLRTPLHCR